MKNLIHTKDSLVAIALGLVIVSTAFTSSEKASVEKVEQFNVVEIADQAVLVDQAPSQVMVYDEKDHLVYQSQSEESDRDLQILLRTSDFLLEVDGVKYYRTYQE